MTETTAYTLGKSERLKSRKLIDALFKDGGKITAFPFRAVYKQMPGEYDLKAGFTVSSRNFPRAVDRNRIKRLMREAYRLEKSEFQAELQKNKQQVYLFFIYTGRGLPDGAATRKSLRQILNKLSAQL